ncbi:hypothetical protein CY0110_15642 [Crocosphaera chwakensis CCY0110]|uniref:Uncharacterized protein n=1 Tax=Crocosphaera chwakensis CCY0110 TaxID=391612 RepID=A3IHG0_9CHRO|nr:hypothetical protein CY0110_15642 [Crocosphaera chwakensis CCY0110]
MSRDNISSVIISKPTSARMAVLTVSRESISIQDNPWVSRTCPMALAFCLS